MRLLELAARGALRDQLGVGRLNPEEMVFEVLFLFLFFTATLLTPSLPNLGSPKTWGGRKGALLALADNQIGNAKVKRSYHRGQLLSSRPVSLTSA